MKGPLDVHLALLEAAVPHEISHLTHRVSAADELPEALGVPAHSCLVVHLYDGTSGPLALVRPAHTEPAPPHGAVELAPDKISALTDFPAGLLPPVCLPAEVPLWLDASLGEPDIVYAATGDGGTALKIRYRDLLKVTGAVPRSLDLRETRAGHR